MIKKHASLNRNIRTAFLAAAGAVVGAAVVNPAAAQTTGGSGTNISITLPTVVVTAQKIPQDADVVPLSVTAIPHEEIRQAGLRTIDDTLMYSPNLYDTEFAPRKNNAPRFRGIGASPLNPGVTTYIDGVPQLNSNSSSQEFAGIDQIEFIRGAQSTLFGRNTIGGVINITSQRPSSIWTGGVEGQYGNFNFRDVRGDFSGPIYDKELSFSIDGGYSARDGYSRNINTGHLVDFRDAKFGKGQLLYVPAENWELRLIVSGERAHDGDYPLGDLFYIRANPHQVNLRFEGYTDRNIFSPTLQLAHTGAAVDFTSTTGGVWWKTYDKTDLNYVGVFGGLPVPHFNQEEDFQFTQEFRLASAKDAPIKFGDHAALKWQSGVLLFTQNYQQDTGELTFGSDRHADLEDVGVGGYGQATLTMFDKLDVIGGARVDYENKYGNLLNVAPPGPTSTLILRKDFTEISPQFGIAWHLAEKQTLYGEVTRGYKAGGFNNATAPSLTLASYGKEHSWDYEAGYKGNFLDDALKLKAAAYYIDWQSLQLNHLGVGGQNFIANAGAAASNGLEFEMSARPVKAVELFATAGYDDARFNRGASDGGVDVGGKHVPYAPDFTVSGGIELTQALCRHATAYARAEAVEYGNFKYDAANGAGQGTYSVANFRAGLRGNHWFVEGWVRNAFDTKYVPTAIAYGGFLGGPSGYVGETGAPVTYGVKAGINF